MTKRLPWDLIVNYGAVGGTRSKDLMTYPPAGFRPFEQRTRIGHGDARWSHAWHSTLTWGIQRNSGVRVAVAESPGHIAEGTYLPVSFDTSGIPIAPATGAEEAVYDPSGNAFISPGDSALLTIPFWFLRFHAPCRVIYVIDEPKRKGFAYGSLPGHPACGEEAFVVSQTDDGSVWLTVRAFSRPSGAGWWVVYPLLRLAQTILTRRYFRALSDPLD
ncbi:MAG: DUF1990 domain-containing protein [Terrimesophilobacter sp.]